ncbi:MAG: type II toxin-antitoxin system VapC family toxin [Lachnospiraceae bacterium]|nr:type II toxin-antitoxin system VapC family toxin [Lachnospiraceae bacterium]
MKYLADTHILLWALEDDPQLPARARDILMDETAEIYYSFANVWEIAIKHSLNKGGILFSAEQFRTLCDEAGFIPLNMRFVHAEAVERLEYDGENAPRDHRDPFDRLLLAQAKTEKMLFITHDSLIPFYHEDCVYSV